MRHYSQRGLARAGPGVRAPSCGEISGLLGDWPRGRHRSATEDLSSSTDDDLLPWVLGFWVSEPHPHGLAEELGHFLSAAGRLLIVLISLADTDTRGWVCRPQSLVPCSDPGLRPCSAVEHVCVRNRTLHTQRLWPVALPHRLPGLPEPRLCSS